MSQSISFVDPYISTSTSVHVLGGLLFLTAAVSWTAVGVDFAQLRLAGEVGSGSEIEVARRLAHTRSGSFVAGTQLVCAAVTAVAFLAWLHRVRVNLRALGMRRMRYGRQWTLLGFVVPFLNLLRPYQVVREIWKASDSTARDPVGWQAVRVPRILAAWWIAFVAYVAFELVSALVLDRAVAARSRQLGHGLGMLADASGAVSASLAYFVVSRISEAQEAKWKARGEEQVEAPLTMDAGEATASTY